MAARAAQRLAVALGELDMPGSFSARKAAPADDLNVEVRGVGALRFPVPDEQARQLCEIARPARHGRGEQTLLDRRVRNTWEIPPSRVRIDKRRWSKTLVPALDALRDDLGLPSGCRLEAELQSMLVYARGQFFLPHQDSEKHDEMVGSLVVTLPAPFTGGTLVVEHKGRRATYRGSKAALSFVAFYADCRHEVKPVRSGHRIVLTYNLLLRQNSTESAALEAPPETVEELARLLEEHFATPRSRWRGDRDAEQPPNRLVYLLDHEYTERGLEWVRLKGRDARRVALLREVGLRAGCDAVLALAKVHETWSTSPSEFDDPWYRRRRYGAWSEWDDDEEGADPDDDDYELDELIEQSVDLECRMEPSAAPEAETRFAFRPGLRGLRHHAFGRARTLRLGVRGLHGQLRQHARSLVPPRCRARMAQGEGLRRAGRGRAGLGPRLDLDAPARRGARGGPRNGGIAGAVLGRRRSCWTVIPLPHRSAAGRRRA